MIPSDYSYLITTMAAISDFLNTIIATGASMDFYRSLPTQLNTTNFVYASYLSNIDILTSSS